MGDDTQKYTVDDALIAMGFGKFQLLLLAYAGMGWISEAMEMMLLSFVGPAVQAEWGLSANKESMITSIVFAGMLIGAYSWGIVSDNFGRKRGFLVTAAVTSGAGFCSALAPNYAVLILFRFFVGVGLGGGPVLSSWFLEFIPAPRRGTWMSVFSAFWTIGTILEASLAWIVMPLLGWRWLLAFSAVPSAFLLIFYYKAPESPRYLCMRGKPDEALQILEWIAKMNKAKLPSGTFVSDHQVTEVTNPLSEDAHLLSPTKDDTGIPNKNSKVQKSASVLTLLSPKLLKSTLLLWVVFIGNAFSYYGLVLLTTELSNRENRCSPGHAQAGSVKTADVSYRDVFIASFAEFPGLLISAAMVDKVGRKGTMSLLFFICCLILLPLAFTRSQVLVTPLLFGARICITATFTIVYIYAPEIYPTAVREINGHNEGSVYAAEINNLSSSRKLDESSSDPNIKCGGCSPCGHPSCYQSPPPPPPPSPPPPPPAPKKPPSGTTYCPPPPPSPSSWIYVPAPPGGLYPVDPNYSYFSGASNLKIIVGYGLLLQMIILWI